MAGNREYEVLRHHEGDRTYAPGETRVASPAEVSHLVGTTLREKKGSKAEQPALNKAEPPADNKAEPAQRLGRRG